MTSLFLLWIQIIRFLFSTNRIGAHRSTSILTFLRTAARGNLDSSFLFNFVRRPTDELFKLLDSLFLDLPIEFLTTESLWPESNFPNLTGFLGIESIRRLLAVFFMGPVSSAEKGKREKKRKFIWNGYYQRLIVVRIRINTHLISERFPNYSNSNRSNRNYWIFVFFVATEELSLCFYLIFSDGKRRKGTLLARAYRLVRREKRKRRVAKRNTYRSKPYIHHHVPNRCMYIIYKIKF